MKINEFSRIVWWRKSLPLLGLIAFANLMAQHQSHAGSLSSLIERATSVHPSIRAQRELGQSSQEAVKNAKWQFYPTPSIEVAQVQSSSRDPSYSFGDHRVTVLRLQQPLWSGGRLIAGLKKADAGVLFSRASEELVRQELSLRVVQSYSDWQGANLKAMAFEENLKVYAGLRQQIVRRIEQGVSPKNDLTLLVGRVEQATADLAGARAQQAAAMARLSQLMGKQIQAAEMSQSVSRPLEVDAEPQEALDRAQIESPSVTRLLAQVRISEAEVAVSKGRLSPEIYVRAERQYGNFSLLNAKPENRIFIGVTSQFGAGLSSLSQVGEAQARYRAALADVDNARSNLGEQVLADYVQAESGKRRLAALAASLQASQAISDAWGRQFLAGRKSWLDIMNAARELAQIEVQSADVEASQLLLTWRLFILTRGVDASINLKDSQDALVKIQKLVLTTNLSTLPSPSKASTHLN